ncbi:DarT1-associated NADAR antitoxin family protein [Burkholderia paludis]|uniref:DarT1-associated NADAR antitoxin family protein n=1 Tax=Burkholderia paludis TaxID=1506587 RepID=UPI0005B76B9F|nr:hypothetical protein [Burkholderia paludis]
MAQRPIFIPNPEGPSLVRTVDVEFEWFPGLSVTQKQRSIDALHAAGRQAAGVADILEISSKSRAQLGVALSAFNLGLRAPGRNDTTSVECAFQGSKVFENGGPYTDMLAMSSLDAKRDRRLRDSGRLVAFRFMNEDWPLEPRTAFYDWLFITALMQHPERASRLCAYSAFTDIEFNPARSINCQAYSAALFVALHARGKLTASGLDRNAFLALLAAHPPVDRDADAGQPSLF